MKNESAFQLRVRWDLLPLWRSWQKLNDWIIKLIYNCKSKGTSGLSWQSSQQDSKFPLQCAWVQSLVRELRFHMLHGMTKNKKTPTKQESLKNPNSKCDHLKTDLEHDFEGGYERLRTYAPRGKQYGITGVGRLGAAGEASHYTLKGSEYAAPK